MSRWVRRRNDASVVDSYLVGNVLPRVVGFAELAPTGKGKTSYYVDVDKRSLIDT